MSVDTKAAICIYPAPLLNKTAASGNATNAGTKVIDPIAVAISVPYHADSLPKTFEICSGAKIDNITPIISKMDRNWGT